MKHPSQLRLAMAQINVIVGDIEGNAQKCLEWMDRARDADADVVTFPELALTGYPPEDLLLKPQFIDANLAALEQLVSRTRDITAIIGFVDRKDDIFNAAAIAQNGKSSRRTTRFICRTTACLMSSVISRWGIAVRSFRSGTLPWA